jgi:hypothetical protein
MYADVCRRCNVTECEHCYHCDCSDCASSSRCEEERISFSLTMMPFILSSSLVLLNRKNVCGSITMLLFESENKYFSRNEAMEQPVNFASSFFNPVLSQQRYRTFWSFVLPYKRICYSDQKFSGYVFNTTTTGCLIRNPRPDHS